MQLRIPEGGMDWHREAAPGVAHDGCAAAATDVKGNIGRTAGALFAPGVSVIAALGSLPRAKQFA